MSCKSSIYYFQKKSAHKKLLNLRKNNYDLILYQYLAVKNTAQKKAVTKIRNRLKYCHLTLFQ